MSVAIITGASSGIGEEFVRQLKELPEIDEFWLIARRGERLAALADQLSLKAKILSADLCLPEGIEAVRSALNEEKPNVRYLVNAAGFGRFGAFDQVSEGELVRMIDLNVKALVLLTHMVIPYMECGGRIIEMGSGSCFTPLPYFNVYASSKAFVLHYTKALNYEIAKYGLRATCFCPGWVATEFIGKATEQPGVTVPRSMKPLLCAEKVVRGCLRVAKKGKSMYVTNWYTKLQHLLFKLLPDKVLSAAWIKMQTANAPASGERAD